MVCKIWCSAQSWRSAQILMLWIEPEAWSSSFLTRSISDHGFLLALWAMAALWAANGCWASCAGAGLAFCCSLLLWRLGFNSCLLLGWHSSFFLFWNNCSVETYVQSNDWRMGFVLTGLFYINFFNGIEHLWKHFWSLMTMSEYTTHLYCTHQASLQ